MKTTLHTFILENIHYLIKNSDGNEKAVLQLKELSDNWSYLLELYIKTKDNNVINQKILFNNKIENVLIWIRFLLNADINISVYNKFLLNYIRKVLLFLQRSEYCFDILLEDIEVLFEKKEFRQYKLF